MSFLQDFKNFAMKGNVIDLAVAVIIGAAFGKIVSSFVNDVLMPPIGLLLGNIDFKDFKAVLVHAGPTTKEVTINYGMFIQNIVDFLIVAFVIFMALRAVMKLQKKKEEVQPPPPEPTTQEKLLTEIRDLLKK